MYGAAAGLLDLGGKAASAATQESFGGPFYIQEMNLALLRTHQTARASSSDRTGGNRDARAFLQRRRKRIRLIDTSTCRRIS